MNTMTRKCPLNGAKQHNGFTLTELMIAVAIVGILAALAYPSYMDSVRRSNRAEGKSLLMDAAARQERFFSNFSTYTNVVVAPAACTGAACGLGYASANSENSLYQLTVTAADATSYTLQAAATGTQTGDTACTPLVLTSLGQKTPANCW